jgi:hypothetical protein
MAYFITILLIIFAAATRLSPHLINFAPITALAIFAAVYLPKKQAIALPLFARLVSDLIIGFYAWPLMLAVYAAHLFGLVLGFWIKNSENNLTRWLKIASSGFISAVVFFLVTNFALLYPGYYTPDLAGIMLSYTNALPFIRGTLIGDVGYTLALFLAAELAFALNRQRQTVKA